MINTQSFSEMTEETLDNLHFCLYMTSFKLKEREENNLILKAIN